MISAIAAAKEAYTINLPTVVTVTRCSAIMFSCTWLLFATKRIDGCPTAEQIASACLASFLFDFT